MHNGEKLIMGMCDDLAARVVSNITPRESGIKTAKVFGATKARMNLRIAGFQRCLEHCPRSNQPPSPAFRSLSLVADQGNR